MENEIILKWIGSFLKEDIDQFVFTCLLLLNHVGEKGGIPGNLKSNLVLVIECLQSSHLSPKNKQQIDRCLADIMKVFQCDKAGLEAACGDAMEKTAEIITIAKAKQRTVIPSKEKHRRQQ
jgi:hypothetical protein